MTGSPVEITNSAVARKNTILQGYAAFNAGQWSTLEQLLCEDSTDSEGNRFPAWHPMEPTGTKRGRREVIDHLKKLRETTEAEFFSMVGQGNVVITMDFSYVKPVEGGTEPVEGDHGCADRVVFDDSGRIREVWHCAAATHEHGHAAGEDHVDH